jgi:hypothetical protein
VNGTNVTLNNVTTTTGDILATVRSQITVPSGATVQAAGALMELWAFIPPGQLPFLKNDGAIISSSPAMISSPSGLNVSGTGTLSSKTVVFSGGSGNVSVSQGSISGTVSGTAGTSFSVTTSSGKLTVGNINAGTSVTLSATPTGGSILQGPGTGISASTVSLTADTNIGDPSGTALLTNTATINATATNGSINVQNIGSVTLADIKAADSIMVRGEPKPDGTVVAVVVDNLTAPSVSLSADGTGSSILQGTGTGIGSSAVTLTAGGSIGTSAAPVLLKSASVSLVALAVGDIDLDGAADIVLGSTLTPHGSVAITAPGALTVSGGAVVSGGANVTLTAGTGITLNGNATAQSGTDPAATDAVLLLDTSGGDITMSPGSNAFCGIVAGPNAIRFHNVPLAAGGGNISLANVRVDTGTVDVACTGNITGTGLVTANTITMNTSAGSIGSTSAPLNINASNLSAAAGNGSVFITQPTGDLTASSLTAGAAMTVSAPNSSLTLGNVTGANATRLTARFVNVPAGVSVYAPVGPVSVLATADLNVGPTATIGTGAGSLVLGASVDANGAGTLVNGAGTLTVGDGALVNGTSITVEGAGMVIAPTATVGSATGSSPTNLLTVLPSLPTLPITLGGTTKTNAGIDLTSAELARIFTKPAGTITFGSTSQTGNITIAGATTATTPGASTVVIENPAGPGKIFLDDGSGIGLNANGGPVQLTSPPGGVVVVQGSPDDVALAIDCTTASGCGLNQAPTFLWSFAPTPGTQITLIHNTGAGPINGTVPGLPPGGLFTSSYLGTTYDFGVQYRATDLVLTSVASPTVGPVVANGQFRTIAASNTNGGMGTGVVGDVVTLTAPASVDSSDLEKCGASPTFTYAWSLLSRPAGSAAVLSNPSAPSPTFVPDVPGTYQTAVSVTDSIGQVSPPVSVSITTSACGAPAVSVVIAQPVMPFAGQPVTLQVSASPDARLGGPLAFHWAQVGGPAVVLHPAGNMATFTPATLGTYQFSVSATDGLGNQGTSPVLTLPVQVGQAPTVGPIVAVPPAPFVGQTVTLADPAASADPALAGAGLSETLSYSWTLVSHPAGSNATLNDPHAVSPSFVPDVPGAYQVALMVTDVLGHASPNTFLSVSCGAAPLPPTVGPIAAVPPAPFVGQTVTLADPAASADPALAGAGLSEALTYNWTLVSRPAGSNATLNDPHAASPSFVPDAPGGYEVGLVVTDVLGHASPSTFRTITAYTNAMATTLVLSAPPTATAGTPFSLTVTAEDSGGNPVLGVNGKATLSSSAGADISSTSVTLVNGTVTIPVTLTTAGSQTITPTFTGLTGVGASITVSPAGLSQYLVNWSSSTGTSTVTAGSNFQVAVQAADVYGNAISSGYSGPASVALSTTPTSPASNFPATVAIPSSGLGLFLGTLQQVGSYTITAASGPFTGSTTTPVTVTPAPAAKLAFGVQPANTITGFTLPPVTVQVEDSYGNVETSDNTDVISVSIGAGPGPFAAGSQTSIHVAGGVATFSSLTLNAPGSYVLAAAVFSPALSSFTFSAAFSIIPLQVVPGSFAGSPSGFSLQFNAPYLVNSMTPVLYGQGFGPTAPAPSVIVTTDPGNLNDTPAYIQGSLVLNQASNRITFVATTTANLVNSQLKGGPVSPLLPDGNYTVFVRGSAATDGIQALGPGGGFLDGRGTGTPGSGDYVATFVVNAHAAGDDAVWVQPTADGPGQPLNAPGQNQANTGYPIELTDSTGMVSNVQVTLNYDPTLLTVTGVTGAGFSLLSSSTPGHAVLQYSGPKLPAGQQVAIGSLLATVPSGTTANPVPYKMKNLLHLSNVSLNGGAIPVATGDALHLVAYVGDGDGNGSYSANDAVLVTAALLSVNTGFKAYQLVDPIIVADTDGSGFIPPDAALQANTAGVGLPTRTLPIPPIPGGVVFIPIGNNVDPILSVGRGAWRVERDGQSAVTVPINIDDPHPAGSTGLIEGHLALTYDPSLFTVSAADIHLGSVLAAGSGWTVTSSIDATTGQIAIALSGNTPITTTQGGSIAIIDFHPMGEPEAIRPEGVASIAIVNSVIPGGLYVRTELEDAQGTFTLTMPANHSLLSLVSNTVSPQTAIDSPTFAGSSTIVVAAPVDQLSSGPSTLDAPNGSSHLEVNTAKGAGVPSAGFDVDVPRVGIAAPQAQAASAASSSVAPLTRLAIQFPSLPLVSAVSFGLAAWQQGSEPLFQALGRATVNCHDPVLAAAVQSLGRVSSGQQFQSPSGLSFWDALNWPESNTEGQDALDQTVAGIPDNHKPALRAVSSAVTTSASDYAVLDQIFVQALDDTASAEDE